MVEKSVMSTWPLPSMSPMSRKKSYVLLLIPATPLSESRYSPSPIECVAVLTPGVFVKVTVQTVLVPLEVRPSVGTTVVPEPGRPMIATFDALRLTGELKE